MEKTAKHLAKVKKTDQLPKMLLNLKNTITDRHSVNDCVNDLLEQWKTEIANVTIDGFNEMDEHPLIKHPFSHPLIDYGVAYTSYWDWQMLQKRGCLNMIKQFEMDLWSQIAEY